ncbi:phospholipid-binding protein MlaC [Thermodesulfobacteriota bacterium]
MARLLIILIFLTSAAPCMAQEVRPLDMVKDSVEQALSILKSPEYSKSEANNKQRDKLWEIIRNVFDFNEMARRTLARNWKRFSPKEQDEFTELFSVFLRNIYLSKIQGGFEDERVEYREEEMLSDSKAVVKTVIIRKDLEIPIDYSLQKDNGTWRVYDVNVEGTRMVRNYRAQFAKILINGTPSHLIETLKKKIEEQNKAGKNPDKDRSDLDLERLTTRLFSSLVSGSKNCSN